MLGEATLDVSGTFAGEAIRVLILFAAQQRDYAAMATPVTSAQVAKAWVRPDRRLAAVSWSRRRGKTLAS